MEILYTRCAGLDVHKKSVKVCLLTQRSHGQPHKEFRTYATMTEELLKLSDWLREQNSLTKHVERCWDIFHQERDFQSNSYKNEQA